MDSRMARDEIDWFLAGDLEIYCFGTPDGNGKREAGHGEQLIAISWAAPV